MKHKTKVSDLQKSIALRAAEKSLNVILDAMVSGFKTGRLDDATRLEPAKAASEFLESARAAHKKIPLPRRNRAEATYLNVWAIALQAAKQGHRYSGHTEYEWGWGDAPTAGTLVYPGDPYSRRCGYNTTNATHSVVLDPAGAVLLSEKPELVNASLRDNLPLIALYPDDSAVWVETCGKRIKARRGWLVGDGSVCFHSTVSRERALVGLRKKIRAIELAAITAAADQRHQRRLRLVARLCGGASATIADARALGFCDPGIRAFQARYGIGDAATLPELVKTGDPSAAKLALKIAHKYAQTKEKHRTDAA